jgi:hypothetical protein
MTAAEIHTELAIIRAKMQATLTLLPAGQCPIEATDRLYQLQEDLLDLLWGMQDAN